MEWEGGRDNINREADWERHCLRLRLCCLSAKKTNAFACGSPGRKHIWSGAHLVPVLVVLDPDVRDQTGREGQRGTGQQQRQPEQYVHDLRGGRTSAQRKGGHSCSQTVCLPSHGHLHDGEQHPRPVRHVVGRLVRHMHPEERPPCGTNTCQPTAAVGTIHRDRISSTSCSMQHNPRRSWAV